MLWALLVDVVGPEGFYNIMILKVNITIVNAIETVYRLYRDCLYDIIETVYNIVETVLQCTVSHCTELSCVVFYTTCTTVHCTVVVRLRTLYGSVDGAIMCIVH